MNDVLLAKKASLDRCLAQIKSYDLLGKQAAQNLDQLVEDGIVLNVQRACELVIDMANQVIRIKKLGVPGSSRESFLILGREGVVDPELAQKMVRMVGFRNLLVHRYKDLDHAILKQVIEYGVVDLAEFGQVALFSVN